MRERERNKGGISRESRGIDKGVEEQGKRRRGSRRRILDSKRSKTGVSSQSDVVQYYDCGCGGSNEAVKLEGEKIYTLAYADDMVLLKKEEEKMRCMIERFGEHLEGKKLEINTDKTKIMRFRKEGGRKDKRV